MIDIERALGELAEHLDHATGRDLAPRIRARLSSPSEIPRISRRRRPLRAIAMASAAAVVLAAVAIPPSREAIADLLGIGAVEIRHEPESAAPPTGSSRGRDGPSAVATDLATARDIVNFPIRLPEGAIGTTPRGVTVDRSVPGGLVTLDYGSFTLVEVASPDGAGPTLAKFIGPGSHMRDVSVRGQPGLWITGVHHELAFIDREGKVRRATVRPSGHVLLWAENGVTFRVEGFERQAPAVAVASSLG